MENKNSKELKLDYKKADKACEIAKDFVRIYYKTLDTSRHIVSKIYSENALLVWNGNGIHGNEKITKFLMDLPGTRHDMKTLDAQYIFEDLTNNEDTYMVQACGEVSYQNIDRKRSFHQTFIIVPMEGKWKIVSDCYRVQLDPKKDGLKS